jgi:hypothetical protein
LTVFATGVVDTGGKFAAAVVDISGNLPPVSLTQVENLPPVLLTPLANLPPISTTPMVPVAKFAADVVAFTCEYLCEFSKKFQMTLIVFSGAWGNMIHDKNLKQRIS